MAAVDDKVCSEGDRTGGKGGVKDGSNFFMVGGRHQGGHSPDAPPAEKASLEGGLGIPPY